MLHAKKYFCTFGILASTQNSKLISISSSYKTLELLIAPELNSVQSRIKNAVKNRTKIQK